MDSQIIHSTKNERVKVWRKLQTKKARVETGTYLIEGYHIVEEAMKQDGLVQSVIYTDEAILDSSWQLTNIATYQITKEVAHFISDTKTEQGIFAIVKMIEANMLMLYGKKFLLTDAVQDPGNLGTLIRTADAAGYDAVVLGKGTVDLYNPKVIRSAQGSHFHIPILHGDLLEWIDRLEEEGVPVYGAVLDQEAKRYYTVPEMDTVALIVGNEGNGICSAITSRLREKIYIPIYGQSESLNVSIAAGILLYHIRKKN